VPRLGAVARQGMTVLPVVAVASAIAWLGIAVGFLALVVPGIYLSLRWFVVAQAAAIERNGWRAALRSSGELTNDHLGHLFALGVLIVVIAIGPFLALEAALGEETSVISFLALLVLMIFFYSFTALVSALAYFDLRARGQQLVGGAPWTTPAERAALGDADHLSGPR